MRAARLLDMLLILQRRGRMTAGDLGTLLEVSERTILRDVEALNEAGVPIYTAQGTGGGIELVEGFETRLTGLTPDEADCLFLVGQPLVAHGLGLAKPTREARHKLLTALPRIQADRAEGLDGWFLHDPDPWAGHSVPHGELRRIADGIRRRRGIELSWGDDRPVVVEPWGLVLKAGSWHLVTGLDGGSVVALDDLRSVRLTTDTFVIPDDFSLTVFWRDHAPG